MLLEIDFSLKKKKSASAEPTVQALPTIQTEAGNNAKKDQEHLALSI